MELQPVGAGDVSDSFADFWEPYPHPGLLCPAFNLICCVILICVDIHNNPPLNRNWREVDVAGRGEMGVKDWERRKEGNR